jgi:oxygen-independent coproporphyrinogen-3 oxidase
MKLMEKPTPVKNEYWLTPRSAYLHIPFCAHHCGYCDFAVTAGKDYLMDLYIEAIVEELRRLSNPQPVETIFLGGGTPSYLSLPQLSRLLVEVNRWLPLLANGEFTIEATPESLSADKIGLLHHHGVNRVSLGVQTFQAPLLQSLDRIHSPEHVDKAIEWLQPTIPNISIDLIFAIPKSTLATWQSDLQTAVRYPIHHISTYGLTYEKGTPLWKQRERGQIDSISEELELEMYQYGIHFLREQGFEHYEISNFAHPEYRCRHNETYWANWAYWGFGVGAARYVQGSRELNTRNTEDYIRKVLAGEDPTFQRETLSPEERARETLAMQLRRADGIDYEQFQFQTGFDARVILQDKLETYLQADLIHCHPKGLALTEKGFFVADTLAVKLAWDS